MVAGGIKLGQHKGLILYALLNFILIFLTNRVSDLPVLLANWESKAQKLLEFSFPEDNFYPPGSAILLAPFLWLGPEYKYVVFIYFVATSCLYYVICDYLFQKSKQKFIALMAFSGNPYLLWLVNSSQDTLFEMFLLFSFIAVLLKQKIGLSLLPLYLLCLTRPSYWVLFLVVPVAWWLLKREKKYLMLVPICFLIGTLGINNIAFSQASLATEGPLTFQFSHHKLYYLAMPKFDMDVFLSKGGNMNPDKVIANSDRFSSISDIHTRAALISIIENPKSLALNTLQKLDSYFFANQKTPQLSGEYYIDSDQSSIIIGEERLTWPLILGHWFYFIYRSALFILFMSGLTLFIAHREIRKSVREIYFMLLLPYLAGSVSGIMFYTETRFKIVSEVLTVLASLLVYVSFSRVRDERDSISK